MRKQSYETARVFACGGAVSEPSTVAVRHRDMDPLEKVDFSKLPNEIREKLAELDLELSEGKHQQRLLLLFSGISRALLIARR